MVLITELFVSPVGDGVDWLGVKEGDDGEDDDEEEDDDDAEDIDDTGEPALT